MRIPLMRILPVILCLVGCGAGQVNIPKKTVTVAEANEAYDAEAFVTVNIPRNCKVVAAARDGRLVVENSSGTQFILSCQDGSMPSPAKIVPDMPELW